MFGRGDGSAFDFLYLSIHTSRFRTVIWILVLKCNKKCFRVASVISDSDFELQGKGKCFNVSDSCFILERSLIQILHTVRLTDALYEEISSCTFFFMILQKLRDI
ncbi:hypothetical protein KP509_07G013600 [Ceratopteris richardii]|uniref:Uncharacterized protein n=1 Tax=Ceratopteris richardii TaxID=49495 RepID=A0A8T2UEJ4_CERRI|nr:hypothetical protein KP509_07G013600 [Ceratopteris richardii]